MVAHHLIIHCSSAPYIQATTSIITPTVMMLVILLQYPVMERETKVLPLYSVMVYAGRQKMGGV